MATLSETALATAHSWKTYLVTREWDSLLALAHPDATYWFSGVTTPGPFFNPFAGSLPFPERVKSLSGQFPPKFTMDTISESVSVNEAKGEGVVWFECAAHGEGPREGQVYDNTVAVRITVDREGKITGIREYLDVIAVQQSLASGKQDESSAAGHASA